MIDRVGALAVDESKRLTASMRLALLAATLIAGLGWGVALAIGPGAEGSGQICVAELPKKAAEIDRDPARRKTRREYTYEFSVKIDDRPWVKVPIEDGVLIRDLPTGRPHTVTIRDRDREIESFTFTFEEKGSGRLCLSYTPWYQTWRLEAPRPRAWWCKCEAKDG
jgi:hypothetical protein